MNLSWWIPRVAPVALLALPVAAAQPSVVGDRASERVVVILSPDEADGRVALTREAIAFWNRALKELELTPRLTEAALMVAPPSSRALENYARRLWQQAGRLPPGVLGPAPPPELAAFSADVVVLLSKQELMSFAWPLESATRFFVAVSADTEAPPHQSGTLRNVIAHELGHTLGIVHNGIATALMCGPCRSPVQERAGDQRFLPLTPQDHALLRELYPAR